MGKIHIIMKISDWKLKNNIDFLILQKNNVDKKIMELNDKIEAFKKNEKIINDKFKDNKENYKIM